MSLTAWKRGFGFRKNLIERILKLIMTIDDEIRDEKLQYDVNREEQKILAVSYGNIDQYEFLTGEEILYLLYFQVLF